MNFDDVLASFEREAFQLVAHDRSALADECLLAAQRGWHARAPAVAWPTSAEGAVRDYFRDELSDDVLATHGHGASRWALFASYAVGWLFALQELGLHDEAAAEVAFAVLPGYMWLHEARISDPTSSGE